VITKAVAFFADRSRSDRTEYTMPSRAGTRAHTVGHHHAPSGAELDEGELAAVACLGKLSRPRCYPVSSKSKIDALERVAGVLPDRVIAPAIDRGRATLPFAPTPSDTRCTCRGIAAGLPMDGPNDSPNGPHARMIAPPRPKRGVACRCCHRRRPNEASPSAIRHALDDRPLTLARGSLSRDREVSIPLALLAIESHAGFES